MSLTRSTNAVRRKTELQTSLKPKQSVVSLSTACSFFSTSGSNLTRLNWIIKDMDTKSSGRITAVGLMLSLFYLDSFGEYYAKSGVSSVDCKKLHAWLRQPALHFGVGEPKVFTLSLPACMVRLWPFSLQPLSKGSCTLSLFFQPSSSPPTFTRQCIANHPASENQPPDQKTFLQTA